MTTETKEQNWTHPKLSAAVAVLDTARRRHSMADTILKRRREDRQTQERLEGEIRRAGLEPVVWRADMPAIEQAHYEGRLVRVSVTDEALELAEEQYAETKAALEAAEGAVAKARKLKPIKQSEIRARAEKTGATYQVIKPLRVNQTDYWPGDLLPLKTAQDVGYRKIDQWQHGPVPTIRRID